MKRTVIGLVAVAFLLIGATTAEKPLPPLAIHVEVAPSSKDRIQLLDRPTPYTYTCRADVTNPEWPLGAISGYGTLDLVVTPGKRESVKKKMEGFDAMLTVAVSKKLDRAAAEVVISRGDQVLHVHKSDVMLQAPERAVIPLR